MGTSECKNYSYSELDFDNDEEENAPKKTDKSEKEKIKN
jgi:hypothetical protein